MWNPAATYTLGIFAARAAGAGIKGFVKTAAQKAVEQPWSAVTASLAIYGTASGALQSAQNDFNTKAPTPVTVTAVHPDTVTQTVPPQTVTAANPNPNTVTSTITSTVAASGMGTITSRPGATPTSTVGVAPGVRQVPPDATASVQTNPSTTGSVHGLYQGGESVYDCEDDLGT